MLKLVEQIECYFYRLKSKHQQNTPLSLEYLALGNETGFRAAYHCLFDQHSITKPTCQDEQKFLDPLIEFALYFNHLLFKCKVSNIFENDSYDANPIKGMKVGQAKLPRHYCE